MKQTLLVLKLLLQLLLFFPFWALSQPVVTTPPTSTLTLSQCLKYALVNQPVVRQARIDEQTTEADIRIARAPWLPQFGLTASGQHYFVLPTTFFPNLNTGINEPRQIGVSNTSTIGLAGTQVIYNNEVSLASRKARFSRRAALQNTANTRINVISNVSKVFYDVLLSQRQLDVFNQDITRLQRNYKDAKARYDAGIVDKTDYLQAEISLNNSLAGRKQAQESIRAKTALLHQQMGLPAERPLKLQYDTLKLETDAAFDTTADLNIAGRVEYQELLTQKSLQHLTIDYYQLGFLPSIGAFGNYNAVYQNNDFGKLYAQRFPNSYAGLQAILPIFTGFRRTQNLLRARLQDNRLDEDINSTRNKINAEYATALASYKSYFSDYLIGKRNLDLAQQVYKVVDLQYREGIKAYIDLLIAQTTLRTSQLNYYTSLFQVLGSKVELQRTLGILPTDY